MNFNHGEIREMFPEYLKGTLSEDLRKTIEVHIRECSSCRSELSMMSELVSLDAPDPGDLYWATLPQKVEGLVRERKDNHFPARSLFLKFVPAAAALAILLVLLLTGAGRNLLYESGTYNDPSRVTYSDYDDLTQEDIYVLTDKTAGDTLYMEPEDILEYSYHGEFASLSSEEIDSLYEALKTEKTLGG